MPRLRLIAQAAGDRAAAAAKRLPRDGRLLAAARGELISTATSRSRSRRGRSRLLGLIVHRRLKVYQAGAPHLAQDAGRRI